MPISLITGPANAGKAGVLLEQLRANERAGLRPILLVPTIDARDRWLAELAAAGPVCSAEVLLFSGLIDRLAARAASSLPQPKALGSLARQRILGTLACEQWPQALSTRIGPILAAGVGELEQAGLKPEEIRRALEQGGLEGSPQIGLLTIHERYLEVLRRLQRSDPDARARAALDAVRKTPSLWGRTPVFMYGFDDLTALQIDAIETLGVIVDAPVTVCLTYEHGRVAFDGRGFVFQQLRALGASELALPPHDDAGASPARAALHHLERAIFEPQCRRVDPGAAVHLIEGASQRAELELLASTVRRLIDEGFDPQQIAIVHRSPASIADELGEALAFFDVPHQIALGVPFVDTAIGAALTGVCRCACARAGLPVRAHAADLLAWLRCEAVLERIEFADAIEERLLRSGVEDGAQAMQIWEKEHWALKGVDALARAAGRGAGAFLQRVREELLRLFSTPLRRRGEILDPEESEDARALTAALAAFEELAHACEAMPEAIGGSEGIVSALEQITLPALSRSRAGIVSVCDPAAIGARRVRALLLCGLQEGVFPARASPDPVLSEPLRALIAESLAAPAFARRRHSLAAERCLLYATVSSAQERLFVSWHANDDDGNPTPPSLFVTDICEPFAEALWERRSRVGGATCKPAAAESTVAGAFPDRPSLRSAPPARRLFDLLKQPSALAHLQDRVLWSASSLEQWVQCPTRWLVERMLSARELEPDPPPVLTGGLAHEVLAEVFEGVRERTGSAQITPRSLTTAKRLVRESLHRRAARQELLPAPRGDALTVRRLEGDLERYLDHVARERAELQPAHLELAFGFDREGEGGECDEDHRSLPAWELGDGVLLRGRIDRVDFAPDGAAVVYDYKSGRVGAQHSGAKWSLTGRLQVPLYMRVVEDLLGRPVHAGLYQPLRGDLRARGAIVADAGLQLSSVSTDRFSAAEVQEIIEAAVAQARAAAFEARSGAFQPRPHSCTPRGGCRYPSICRCEL